MKHIKYALSHCINILLILCIVICLITTGLSEVISQLQSAKKGVEVILVDTTLSVGSDDQFRKNIQAFTQIKYVGISTVDSSSAEEYIHTIENYSMTEYLKYLTLSRNAEILIVPQTMLETVYQMDTITPLLLDVPEQYREICSHDDTVYAFPFRHLTVTDYGATLLSAQSEVFGILLAGADHTEVIRQYLASLAA